MWTISRLLRPRGTISSIKSSGKLNHWGLHVFPGRGARFMFRPSRPKFGVFRPFSTKNWYVSSLLDRISVCFDRARQKKVALNRAPPKQDAIVLEVCFEPTRGMFRPRSRYVSNWCSTQSTVSNILYRSSTDIFLISTLSQQNPEVAP